MLSLRSIPSEVSDSILNSVLWFTQNGAGNRESIFSSLNTSDSELIALIARGVEWSGAVSSEILKGVEFAVHYDGCK